MKYPSAVPLIGCAAGQAPFTGFTESAGRTGVGRGVVACVDGTLVFVGCRRCRGLVRVLAAVIDRFVHRGSSLRAWLSMEGAGLTEDVVNGVGRADAAGAEWGCRLGDRAVKNVRG